MKSSISISTMILLVVTLTSAQAPVTNGIRFQLTNESSITIEGTSTINSFTCKSQYIQGSGTATSTTGDLMNPDIAAEIAAQVKLFDCGHGPMNRDLWSALKSDDHPLITYRLDGAVVEPQEGDSQPMSLRATGSLIIAGVERPIQLVLAARLLDDGTYSATGQQDIKMSDFEVERPTALLGLIKANDEISIHFDLRSTATVFESTQE